MKKKYDYALISGGFDPVHIGHLAMIRDAKNISKNVIVLLNSDKWLIRKKGKPFMVESQRAQLLEEFESVSEVIIQNSDDDDSSNNAIIDIINRILIILFAIVMVEIEVKKVKFEKHKYVKILILI